MSITIKLKLSNILEALNIVKVSTAKNDIVWMSVQAAEACRIMISACDGASQVNTIIGAESTKSVDLYVQHSMLVGILNQFARIPIDNDEVEMEVGKVLTVKRGDSKVNLPLEDKASYISPTKISKDDTFSFTVEGHWLKKALVSAYRRADKKNEDTNIGWIYIRVFRENFSAGATDGKWVSIMSQCPVKDGENMVFKEDKDCFDMVFVASRAKALADILKDNIDTKVYVCKNSVTFAFGETIIMIPKASSTEWASYTRFVGLLNDMSKAPTFEVDRKSFLNALDIVSCNISKKDTDSWGVVFSNHDNMLEMTNLQGSAMTKIEVTSSDGNIGENAMYSILRLKEIVSGLEGESLLLSINGGEKSSIHIEEGREQIGLIGVKARTEKAVKGPKSDVEEQ